MITVKILKYIFKQIVNPRVHIYNLSIKNSIFSDKFDLALIKRIYKGGDCKIMNNYRPISMLTNFSRIFE